ncbi:GNAT family N-acetyltransferase [Candidatus Pelagibacter sp.]|nr:GNAT family N-acetyltransferase [Candidatus Pelagibacter sp.]|tara:strand:- start:69 stop:545 length:477 start_codon:yes stop_codon:yes gene_type:complete
MLEMLKSIRGNFNNPEVNELLIKHFIELRSVSPEGSAHVLDIAGLKDPSIKFWSLWDGNNLMGIGALKFLDKEHGEFKSIRVNDKFRGKGNAPKVINHLINEAKILNIKRLSLETGAGDFFLAARKLFNKCGFKTCEPFSHYKNDVNSVYMTMLISNK